MQLQVLLAAVAAMCCGALAANLTTFHVSISAEGDNPINGHLLSTDPGHVHLDGSDEPGVYAIQDIPRFVQGGGLPDSEPLAALVLKVSGAILDERRDCRGHAKANARLPPAAAGQSSTGPLYVDGAPGDWGAAGPLLAFGIEGSISPWSPVISFNASEPNTELKFQSRDVETGDGFIACNTNSSVATIAVQYPANTAVASPSDGSCVSIKLFAVPFVSNASSQAHP